jgi:uncharacterized protein YbjT (DUF2867 family)
MILITGATGFVGSALIRNLNNLGKPIRLLLRPSSQSPKIPHGVNVEVAVSSLNDERGLLAAMRDVEIIYHLAGTERAGSRADLNGVDIQGTETLAGVAARVGVERFIYLSHLGADRASAFPVMKAKGIAEGLIKKAGVNYTIFRSSAAFGPNDQFTTMIKKILRVNPFLLFIPGDGLVNLQPLWIEDLVTCLTWALEEEKTINQTFPIGGCEYLTFRQIVELIMEVTHQKRTIVNSSPAFLRAINLFAEQALNRSPVSIYWLDYLAVDHTTALDTLPRLFGLMPARMSQMTEYLKD